MVYFFPETNKNRYTSNLSVRYFFKNYAVIFGNALFNRKLLCSSLIYAGEIILITVSPFIIQTQLDFSSSQFGLIFAFVILGFMCGAFTSAQLLKKFTSHQVIKIGLIMALIDTILFAICSVVSVINIVMVTTIMGGFMFSAGFVYPNVGAQIIGIFPDKAGSAGAAMGATQALMAGTLGFLLPHLYKGDSNLSINILLLFIVVCLLVVYYTTRSFKLINEKEARTLTTH